jgi:hypothetical protein
LEERLGVGLVAPNPIKPIGNGAATTVPLAQDLADDMGDGGGIAPAVAADRNA